MAQELLLLLAMGQHTNAPLTRDQELELLAGLIGGAEDTWRQFHAQYGRLIYRCIRKATCRFSTLVRGEDEREIYSNLLLQLLANDKRKLRLFEAERGSRLSTWLGLLATNAAYDYLRTVRRQVPRVPLSEAACTQSDQASPLEEVEQKQRSRMVADIMTRLSPKDRQFVALYFDRGMSPEDVAMIMKISVKTVYSKRHKIQNRLEDIVAAHRLAA